MKTNINFNTSLAESLCNHRFFKRTTKGSITLLNTIKQRQININKQAMMGYKLRTKDFKRQLLADDEAVN